MARKRRSAKGGASTGERWFSRLFWVSALALCAYFWGGRVVRPIVEASGLRRVEAHASVLCAVADEFELDPNLLAGVMLAESSGRTNAVSSAGALGLFQLMLPTARERAELLGLDAPSRDDLLYDGALNARLAGSYLRWLLRRYKGELEPALVAYNAGPGRLERWVAEFGSYAAWRAAREDSSTVLAYARKVQAYAERFAERGAITPRYDQPPAPSRAPFPAPAAPFVGPPSPSFDLDAQ